MRFAVGVTTLDQTTCNLAFYMTCFPALPGLHLTATADERTRSEIAKRLTLENATHFCYGVRSTKYSITGIALKNSPRNQLLLFLKEEHANDAGIVYCLSRKKTEETASWLSAEGFNALPYHAGLPAATRASNQAAFLREEGVIVVATIAFGMGIDKTRCAVCRPPGYAENS